MVIVVNLQKDDFGNVTSGATYEPFVTRPSCSVRVSRQFSERETHLTKYKNLRVARTDEMVETTPTLTRSDNAWVRLGVSSPAAVAFDKSASLNLKTPNRDARNAVGTPKAHPLPSGQFTVSTPAPSPFSPSMKVKIHRALAPTSISAMGTAFPATRLPQHVTSPSQRSLIAQLHIHAATAPPPPPPPDGDFEPDAPSRAEAIPPRPDDDAPVEAPTPTFTGYSEWDYFLTLLDDDVALPPGWVAHSGFFTMQSEHVNSQRYKELPEVTILTPDVVFGAHPPANVTGPVLLTKESPNVLIVRAMGRVMDDVTPFTPNAEGATRKNKFMALGRLLGKVEGVDLENFIERRFSCLWQTKRGFQDRINRTISNDDDMVSVLSRGVPVQLDPAQPPPRPAPVDSSCPHRMEALLVEVFELMDRADPTKEFLEARSLDTAYRVDGGANPLYGRSGGLGLPASTPGDMVAAVGEGLYLTPPLVHVGDMGLDLPGRIYPSPLSGGIEANRVFRDLPRLRKR